MAPAVETVAAVAAPPVQGAAAKAVDKFELLVDQLMAGQWDGMTPADWQLVTVQGGMRVALVMVILFISLTLAGWASGAVQTGLTRMKFDPTLSKFLAKMARWSVLLLAGLNCLGYFGVEMTMFATVLGATGFAIGLALQGTLSNFAAGAMLLLFRPFKVGDTVSIAGHTGKVDEIELFTTSIDTSDNRRIILPNGSVFGATIENVTYHPMRRIDVVVGADYAADIDMTRRALERALVTTAGILATPEPEVVLTGLGASSVDWRVQGWAPSKDFGAVKQALIRSVKLQLDASGVGIPFPQMQIHVSEPPQQAARRAA
jgi:small conductance mechanosensitive channel